MILDVLVNWCNTYKFRMKSHLESHNSYGSIDGIMFNLRVPPNMIHSNSLFIYHKRKGEKSWRLERINGLSGETLYKNLRSILLSIILKYPGDSYK